MPPFEAGATVRDGSWPTLTACGLLLFHDGSSPDGVTTEFVATAFTFLGLLGCLDAACTLQNIMYIMYVRSRA